MGSNYHSFDWFCYPFFLIWIGNNQLNNSEIQNQKSLIKAQVIKVLDFFPYQMMKSQSPGP